MSLFFNYYFNPCISCGKIFLSDGKFFKKFTFQEIQSLFLASAEIGMHFQRQSSYFTHVKVAQFLLSDSTFVHATNYLLA